MHAAARPTMTHMTLTLVAASLNEQPLSQPITAVFDSRGGTIGRADHNTMTLPDPQRHVSRLQAEIVLHGREYLIRNVGAANPIMVGARSLAHGELAPVQEDELIRIGGYLLKARLGDAPVPQPGPGLSALTPVPAPPSSLVAAAVAPAAPVVVAPPVAPGVSAPPVPTPDPFADLLGPTPSAGGLAPASVDPFADLLGSPDTAAAPAAAASADPFADLMPPPAGVHARSAAVAPPAPAAARLPDDFDPFATPSTPLPTPEARPATADPFADLLGSGPGASIDALFGLGAGAPAGPAVLADDPLAGFMAQAQSMAPAPGADPSLPGMSTDPLALFGADAAAAPSAPPIAQPAQPDHLAAIHAAWQPPRVQSPFQATPPPVLAPAPTAAAPLPNVASAADAAALWAAFCQGAGIDVRVPPHEVAARLHEVGRILRSAVDGTLQLVAVRASTKHELRAGVTVIQQRDNNPLKFTPDARSALEQLLQPPLRGFLEGPAAMDDAMHDLVGHAIGSVAGLRAAVEGMLDRFAPEALASKLSDGSFIDNLLPMNRKARLWDLYLQHNQAIREEAQEDFHTLFGKAFVAAYQQQIERLQREGAGRP